jgi:hypothetical protein
LALPCCYLFPATPHQPITTLPKLEHHALPSQPILLSLPQLGPLFKNTSIGPLYSGCRLTLLR